jgi:hypothetical protein
MEVHYYNSGALDCPPTSQNLHEEGGFTQAKEIFFKIFQLNFFSSHIFGSSFLGKCAHFGSGKTPSVDNNSFSSNTSYFLAARA